MNKSSSQVVHSSLRLFNQQELDFPQSDPKLGILVNVGYSKQHSKQMASVYYESPIVVAPGKGESEIEVDEIVSFIRTKSIDIAATCRQLAKELTNHAIRLEELACEEDDKLVEINYGKLDNKANDKNGVWAGVILDDSQSYKITRQHEMSKSHDKRVEQTTKKEEGATLADIIRKRMEDKLR